MKNIIPFCFFLMIVFNGYSQSDSTLKYTFDKENVVASAIDGSWKSVEKDINITFEKDTTILEIIPKKYYKFLSEKPIYHAGYMTLKNKKKEKKHPFLLTVLSGNPHLVFFRERNGDPLGDGESFNLFIVKRKNKTEEKLYIGGDFNNEEFREFIRINN